MSCVRYGRAGYGPLAALRWYIAKIIWLARGRPAPGFLPIGVRAVNASARESMAAPTKAEG